MSSPCVREAITALDLAAVERLRYEVYTAEMGLYRDSADNERRQLCDEHDKDALQLLGEVDGVAVGTVRLHIGPLPADWVRDLDLAVFDGDVAPERMAFGSRFTVLPEHRGTPVVLELVKGCYRGALEAGCELLLLDCVPHLMNLYEGLGWRRYTRHTLEDAHTGVLVPMALSLRDREHLLRVRSPFLALHDEIVGDCASGARACIERHFDRDDLSIRPGAQMWPAIYRLFTSGERSLLSGLSEDDVAALLERSQILDLAPWQTFVRQGTVYRTLFSVLDGGVEIYKDGSPVCDLGRGEVVGEVSWLLGIERTADVCAGERGARVIALHESTVRRVLRRQPAIGVTLMANLARTLAARLTSATWSQPALQGAL